MKKIILFLSFGLIQIGALAQETDHEFETDRPTRTEASSTVPRGYFQLESGFQYQKKTQDGVANKQWLYPQALLRIGVLKAAELRLEATFRREDYRASDILLQREKGLSTVRVGTKVNVLEANGAVPEVSVLAMVEVPWGADSFEPRKVAPEAMLLLSNELTDKIKLQHNAGFRREPEEGEMENKLQFSATLSGELSDKFTLSAEFSCEKPKDSPAENIIDGAIQYLVLPNVQLDAIVGTGVSSRAPELFVGGGLSYRLPR